MTSEASTIAEYGTWPSTISAERVAAGATPMSSLMLGGADGGDIFWLAGRAAEAGRNTLLRPHGAATDELTPAPFNVRSRVHENGGGGERRIRSQKILAAAGVNCQCGRPCHRSRFHSNKGSTVRKFEQSRFTAI